MIGIRISALSRFRSARQRRAEIDRRIRNLEELNQQDRASIEQSYDTIERSEIDASQLLRIGLLLVPVVAVTFIAEPSIPIAFEGSSPFMASAASSLLIAVRCIAALASIISLAWGVFSMRRVRHLEHAIWRTQRNIDRRSSEIIQLTR